MRIVFAGTPQAAVPALDGLVAAGHELVAVVTREDAPVGRKRVLTPSPVAARAEELGLEVVRANRLDEAVAERLLALEPDPVAMTADLAPLIERVHGPNHPELTRVRELTFAAPDHEAFPCLGLAFEALKRGGTAPAVLNAANEVAVTRFLDGTIGFLDIPRIAEAVLNMHTIVGQPAIADVIDADTWAREQARSISKAHQAPGNRS